MDYRPVVTNSVSDAIKQGLGTIGMGTRQFRHPTITATTTTTPSRGRQFQLYTGFPENMEEYSRVCTVYIDRVDQSPHPPRQTETVSEAHEESEGSAH